MIQKCRRCRTEVWLEGNTKILDCYGEGHLVGEKKHEKEKKFGNRK